MMQIIKRNWILVIILGAGLILRIYKPLALFAYSHDQDLLGWFVRDVFYDHHVRLIGQETSSHGVFIGPFFYYLTIPFYMLTKMDPAGTLLLPIIFGVFAIWSVYFVGKEIFNKQVGLLGSLIYALSTLIVFTDREANPTTVVMLWTIWFLCALTRVLKGQKHGYLLIGLLVGLIWSINLQLVILLPLVVLAQIFSKKKIRVKELIIGILIAVVMNMPFLAFEMRHNFQQTKAIVADLTTNKDYVAGTAKGIGKLDRVMQLVGRNTTSLYWDSVFNIGPYVTFWVLVITFAILVWKRKIEWKLAVIFFLWQVLYILFFTLNSINVSEYYLNGMNIIFIFVAACGITELTHNRKIKVIGYVLVCVFVVLNLYSFFTRPINASGYVERKAVIEYIKTDALEHNYPCVSLSFIVSPGNDLGYRYFTWEAGLKTKPVIENAPVYSIVFPHSKVDRIDKSFGALGLVLPDYKRYNEKVVEKICEGEDYTLSQPMFGFTK